MQFPQSTIELVGPPGPRLAFLLKHFRPIFTSPVGWIHTYPLPVPFLLQSLRGDVHQVRTIRIYDQTDYRQALEDLMKHELPFSTIICGDFPTILRSHPFLVAIKQWVSDHQCRVIFLSSKSLNMFDRTIQVGTEQTQQKEGN